LAQAQEEASQKYSRILGRNLDSKENLYLKWISALTLCSGGEIRDGIFVIKQNGRVFALNGTSHAHQTSLGLALSTKGFHKFFREVGVRQDLSPELKQKLISLSDRLHEMRPQVMQPSHYYFAVR
jgi:hypothetical protein